MARFAPHPSPAASANPIATAAARRHSRFHNHHNPIGSPSNAFVSFEKAKTPMISAATIQETVIKKFLISKISKSEKFHKRPNCTPGAPERIESICCLAYSKKTNPTTIFGEFSKAPDVRAA